MDDPDFPRLELEPSSPLYVQLCQEDEEGNCTLPSKVVLDANLVYDDVSNKSAEYSVDTIRTVKMVVGSETIWYEYVKMPCVEHSYYRDAKRVIKGEIWNDKIQQSNMCADPVLEAATPMCNDPDSLLRTGKIYCHYQGERTSFASASGICEANGEVQGYTWYVKQWRAGPCQDGITQKEFRSWTSASCGLKVKVQIDSALIAIVHSPGPDLANKTNVENHVDIDTVNFFAVPWEGGTYPSSSDDCLATTSCELHGDAYCICDTDSTESLVYAAANQISSIDQLMSELHIGSVDPSSFDAYTYTSIGNCGIANGLNVYTHVGGSCGTFDADTIFAFEFKSKMIFLKNTKSLVSIPGSAFIFRNPVQ